MAEEQILTRIELASSGNLKDIRNLFDSNSCIQHCCCTWFLQSVGQYHSNTSAENWAIFLSTLENSPEPVGLVGYDSIGPVAWCALGPRSRYERVLKTPTYKGRDKLEDDLVWLASCFFIKPEFPKKECMQKLLNHAVSAAQSGGAIAIEGIPFSGSKLRTSGDTQVGIESVFLACGFEPIHRPSAQRVLMRRNL